MNKAPNIPFEKKAESSGFVLNTESIEFIQNHPFKADTPTNQGNFNHFFMARATITSIALAITKCMLVDS